VKFLLLKTALVLASFVPVTLAAQSTGTCTATQHRGYQTTVENACGAATTCTAADTKATLNTKIGQHSRCIDARKVINNTCFGGGDAGHKQAITERTNAIAKCQGLMPTAK
jgi:Novel toxin 16